MVDKAKTNRAGSPLERFFGQEDIELLQEFLRAAKARGYRGSAETQLGTSLIFPPWRGRGYIVGGVSFSGELVNAGCPYGAAVLLCEDERLRGGRAECLQPGAKASIYSPLTLGAFPDGAGYFKIGKYVWGPPLTDSHSADLVFAEIALMEVLTGYLA
jgi:hypothetical protein